MIVLIISINSLNVEFNEYVPLLGTGFISHAGPVRLKIIFETIKRSSYEFFIPTNLRVAGIIDDMINI